MSSENQEVQAVTEAAEPEKKPVRRRSTKAKAAQVEEQAAAPETEAKPKRATRSRKKAAEEVPAPESVPAPEAVEEAPAKKPARRTSRAKAAAEADAATQAPAAAPEAPAAAPEAEAKPKRTPRRKKAEAAPAAEPVEAAPVLAPQAEAAPEPVAASAASEQPAAEGTEAPAAEPTSKRTRRRVHVAEAKEPAEASEGADGQTAEKGEADTSESRRGRRSYRERRAERNQQNGSANAGRNNRNQQGNNANGNGNGRNQQKANFRNKQRHNRNEQVAPSITREELAELKVAELRAKAAELGVDGAGVKKAELIELVFDAAMRAEGFIEATGILDLAPEGYGFLRTSGYLPGEHDAYVGLATIRRYGLRKGDELAGQLRPAREGDKFPALQRIDTVNGIPAEDLLTKKRVKFADLTPIYPDERLVMEHGQNTITARMIDLIAPIGKGQRGLIVSPPKAGKTTVLKDIAAAIAANNPDVKLMCLLVDERPEEVTDMQRSIKGEVISSTFDMPCENHIAVAELVIERAKRLVETGKDVVILLDSITRLARAYNLAQPASGRILSGGVDSTALYPPKRFLGAARNIENGGSLTILASALIDTGSKMDEVIFEEFKGTGNMELKLDRNLADRRIFPAIDVVASGTRKEELLLNEQQAPFIWGVRRILANLNNTERATDMMVKSLKRTRDNEEFLIRTAKRAQKEQAQQGFEI